MGASKHRKRAVDLVNLIRLHNAEAAITPSASRQMVRKGDILHVRKFLKRLDIKSFSRRGNFARSLDRATNRLAKHLPKGKWGAARKFLNLYLRRTTYNFYLRQAYGLDRIEHLLELPMDSYAADGLKQEPEGENLPDWLGVRHLTPEANALYQMAASRVAKRLSTCRVHLDMMYWRAKPRALRKRRI